MPDPLNDRGCLIEFSLRVNQFLLAGLTGPLAVLILGVAESVYGKPLVYLQPTKRLFEVTLAFGCFWVGLSNLARKSFEETFSPEFNNRLNKKVVFHPLTSDGLSKVLDVKMSQLNEEYEEVHNARLSLSEATRDHLIAIAAEESHLGARPLVRAFEDNVQSMFGRYAGKQKIIAGTHVRVFHRSEVPEGYPVPDERDFVLAMKPDEALQLKLRAEEPGKELVKMTSQRPRWQEPVAGPVDGPE